MENFLEKFLGRKKESEPLIQEPTFEDLIKALPDDNLRNELRGLAKEVSGEAGPPVGCFKGNYDDLVPEQKRFNDLLGMARREYFGAGEEKNTVKAK